MQPKRIKMQCSFSFTIFLYSIPLQRGVFTEKGRHVCSIVLFLALYKSNILGNYCHSHHTLFLQYCNYFEQRQYAFLWRYRCQKSLQSDLHNNSLQYCCRLKWDLDISCDAEPHRGECSLVILTWVVLIVTAPFMFIWKRNVPSYILSIPLQVDKSSWNVLLCNHKSHPFNFQPVEKSWLYPLD